MNQIVAAAVLIGLSGCRSSAPSVQDDASLDQVSHSLKESVERLAVEQANEEKWKAQYAGRFAVYKCNKSDVPVTKIQTMGLTKFGAAILPNDLRLRLNLGEQIDLSGNHGPYRTESRYVLSTISGTELGRAERMIAFDEYGPTALSGRIFYSTATKNVMAEEQTGGAGGSFRHVVFIPDADASLDTNGAPLKWPTFHVDLPDRHRSVGESEYIGHVLGIANGIIYVEMDKLYYAFPIKDFIATTLEFSIG